jgi:hypothetical protein
VKVIVPFSPLSLKNTFDVLFIFNFSVTFSGQGSEGSDRHILYGCPDSSAAMDETTGICSMLTRDRRTAESTVATSLTNPRFEELGLGQKYLY